MAFDDQVAIASQHCLPCLFAAHQGQHAAFLDPVYRGAVSAASCIWFSNMALAMDTYAPEAVWVAFDHVEPFRA